MFVLSEDEKRVAEIAYGLPVCTVTSGMGSQNWGINWIMPKTMKPYLSNIACAPKLQKNIIERCQAVFNTGQIDVDSAEISFHSNGIEIMVRPGDACDIFLGFDGHFSSGHNVDNASQAYALLILFQIILREIYECCIQWVEDPQFCLEERPTDKTYHATRPIQAKPIRLWRVEVDYCTIGVLLARDFKEAQEKALRISADADVVPAHDFEDIPINGLLSFSVEVVFEDQKVCPNQVLTVLAYDADQAECLALESLSPQPSLSPIVQVFALDEGKPLTPCVLRESGN